MKKLIVLILALAIGLTSCAPAPNPSSVADAQPAKNSPALPTPAQTSKIPLSESLLLVRYISKAQGNVLTAIDPASGAELAGIKPISLGQTYTYTISPDRKTLAVVAYPSNTYPYSPHLYLVNLENWALTDLNLKLKDWISGMEFAPDNRHLAIASGEANSRLAMVDVSQAQVTAQRETDFSIRKLKFNADSTALMLYGITFEIDDGTTSGDPVAVLASADGLDTLWKAELPQIRDGVYRKEGT